MSSVYIYVYMLVDVIPKPLVQQQLVPMTVKEAAEEDSSELTEVLITDLSLRRLRQHSSYANSESSGNISNSKRYLLFYPVSL